MIIAQPLIDELIGHARDEAPYECCGLISAHDGELACVIPCTNAAESMTRYEIEGVEQMQCLETMHIRGWTLGAIYHSHTMAAAYPSQMDIESAFYPDALYIIVGLRDSDFPEVRAFRIVNGEVTEEPLVVT